MLFSSEAWVFMGQENQRKKLDKLASKDINNIGLLLTP